MRNTLLSFFIVSSSVACSQNLVPNPGFEAYRACPGYFSQSLAEFQANDWTAAGTGTPDLFNACSDGEADVPYNWAGVSDAFDGRGFAGIYVWMKSDNNYREYLQCKLNEPLVKDSMYVVRFRYRLSSYSKYAVDRIGLVLRDTFMHVTHDQVIRMVPTVSVIRDSALTLKTGLWETANSQYKASGGERYLVIGNFFDNEITRYHCIQSRPVQQDMLANSAYYYIDGVEVVSPYFIMKNVEATPSVYFDGTGEINTTYILNNIKFEFNRYRLLPESFEELNRLADHLQKHPVVNVTLSGHTDDVGSEVYNQELSLKRAATVREYLVRQSIDRKRVRIFGYGKSKPLFRDASDLAKKANRRVEVTFSQ